MRPATLSLLALASLTLPACPDDPEGTTLGTTTTTGTTAAETGQQITTTAPDPTTTLPPQTTTTTSSETNDADSETDTTDTASSTGSASTSSTTAPDTTGDTSTGGTTSTGTGTTSNGTTSTSTTSNGTTSTDTTSDDTTSTSTPADDTTSTTDDGTTGDTDGGEDLLECGWLLRSHIGKVTLDHAGTRFISRDPGGHLALWDAAAGTRVATFHGVDSAELADATLVYRSAGQLHVLDPSDASELAVCPSGTIWGLSTDGSYLWTADNSGIDLLELDCDLRWTRAGMLADARVLAVADGVHAYDADLSPTAVTHYDVTDGTITGDPFLGTFTSWFVDVPRFWTTQGNTKRIYDVDNTVLKLGADIFHGAGTRYLGTGVVRDVYTAPVIAQLGDNYDAHGSVILTYDADDPQGTLRLVHMDKDPMDPDEPVSAPCCYPMNYHWDFAYADGAWVTANGLGFVGDHQQRTLTVGQIDGIAGGVAGRVTIGTADLKVRVHDIESTCEAVHHPVTITRNLAGGLATSSDGTLLLAADRIPLPMVQIPRWGTRFYTLPEGTLFHELTTEDKLDSSGQHAVDDNATIWSRVVSGTGYSGRIAFVPPGNLLGGSSSHVLSKLAPDGAHFATTDAFYTPGGWSFATTSIVRVEPKALVGVGDGVPHGFIDDEHLLVGHYGDNNVFEGSDIVGLDGQPVQPTTLPDIHHLTHVATGEIVVIVEPDNHAAIYDPWTGTLLWSSNRPDTTAVVAGLDLIAVSDGADVELIKWR